MHEFVELKDFAVGQKACLLEKYPYSTVREPRLVDVEILSVGRVWVTAIKGGNKRLRFRKITSNDVYHPFLVGEHSFSGSGYLFVKLEDYEKWVKHNELVAKLKNTVWSTLSLDKLRRINDILEKE